MHVNSASLPQEFINIHFNGIGIAYTDRNFNEIEVLLADGAKAEFWSNGNWKKIKLLRSV